MKDFKSIFWILTAVTLIGPTNVFAQEGSTAEKKVEAKKIVKKKKVVKKSTNKKANQKSSRSKVGRKKAVPQKVDVKNLEKKYWAPKDGKFTVVQNRTYTKTKKLHLSILPSLMLNEEYGQGFGVVGALGYYFNDRWGLEAEYQFIDIEDNDLQDSVVGLGGFANSSRTTGYYGITGKFMPLYAKMSWLGSRIVYFDLSFGVSLGVMNYQPRRIAGLGSDGVTDDLGDEQTSFAYGFEVSQSFYLSKKLLIRVDYKQRFFNEEVFIGTGTGVSDTDTPSITKDEDRIQDSISLNLGLTYIF